MHTYCTGHTDIFNDERIMVQTSPTIYFKSLRPPLHNIAQIEINTLPRTRLVMLIINKPRLPPIHLNRPTAAFEPDSAAPRLVLRLQWACFGGLVGRLGLLMIHYARRSDIYKL